MSRNTSKKPPVLKRHYRFGELSLLENLCTGRDELALCILGKGNVIFI